MATLYLRDVPQDVVDRLARLAARERISVNAYAARELAESARRADNADLLAALPNLSVATEEIADAIDDAPVGK